MICRTGRPDHSFEQHVTNHVEQSTDLTGKPGLASVKSINNHVCILRQSELPLMQGWLFDRSECSWRKFCSQTTWATRWREIKESKFQQNHCHGKPNKSVKMWERAGTRLGISLLAWAPVYCWNCKHPTWFQSILCKAGYCVMKTNTTWASPILL